jgi:hypothetical protein
VLRKSEPFEWKAKMLIDIFSFNKAHCALWSAEFVESNIFIHYSRIPIAASNLNLSVCIYFPLRGALFFRRGNPIKRALNIIVQLNYSLEN